MKALAALLQSRVSVNEGMHKALGQSLLLHKCLSVKRGAAANPRMFTEGLQADNILSLLTEMWTSPRYPEGAPTCLEFGSDRDILSFFPEYEVCGPMGGFGPCLVIRKDKEPFSQEDLANFKALNYLLILKGSPAVFHEKKIPKETSPEPVYQESVHIPQRHKGPKTTPWPLVGGDILKTLEKLRGCLEARSGADNSLVVIEEFSDEHRLLVARITYTSPLRGTLTFALYVSRTEEFYSVLSEVLENGRVLKRLKARRGLHQRAENYARHEANDLYQMGKDISKPWEKSK